MSLIKYITDVQFGLGAVKSLYDECERAAIRRPLIVTDKGVRAAGVADLALSSISGKLPCVIFDDTPGNPTEAAVEAACALYRMHEADGIIAIGGGSSLDLAKGVAIAATHPAPFAQYCTIDGGSEKFTAQCAPTIAIPTTAGTGSEVARGAIIILHDGRKVGFHSWHLVPQCAICDPELTVALPASLTAATGMDAIAHCIESFLAPAFNPPAEGIALDGLERALRWIGVAVEDGKNLEARQHMMSASMQGGMAFQKGLGAVHSLSHALGSYREKSLHHGTLNAILLPAVLRFNETAPTVLAQDKYSRLKRAAGLSPNDSLDDMINGINRKIGIPAGLGELGLSSDFVAEGVQKAMLDHCHATNPRIATEEQYTDMIRQSW